MNDASTTRKTGLLTVLALTAFAANSILCRLALDERTIDAGSFTTLRLLAGAVALLLVSALRSRRGRARVGGGWTAGSLLFLYAAAFSFAYLSLSAGSGALILFAAVQLTMIVASLLEGERPARLEWLGLAVALAGLLYLVSPGLSAPSASGSLLMVTAGVAWGLYSLLGRGVRDPTGVTTRNFARAVPLTLLLSGTLAGRLELSLAGALLAVASGALTSGLGYVIWYAALPGLSGTRAATVQLSVPVLAAGGGVLFLSEPVTLRLLLSAGLILGGIGLSVLRRSRHHRDPGG